MVALLYFEEAVSFAAAEAVTKNVGHDKSVLTTFYQRNASGDEVVPSLDRRSRVLDDLLLGGDVYDAPAGLLRIGIVLNINGDCDWSVRRGVADGIGGGGATGSWRRSCDRAPLRRVGAKGADLLVDPVYCTGRSGVDSLRADSQEKKGEIFMHALVRQCIKSHPEVIPRITHCSTR